MSACIKRIVSRNGALNGLSYKTLNVCQIKRNFVYGMGLPAPPELRDIVKLELLEQETEKRIEEIWLDQYRFDPRYISRSLDKTNHEKIISRFEECPIFIWPINYSTTNRYYVLLSQYQHKHIFLTSIDSFNNDPENASAFMSVTFYDDLLTKQKNISLIRGEVIQSVHLQIEIARNLMDDIIDKYKDDEKYRDVQNFNKNPKGFDLDAYLNTFDFVKNANSDPNNQQSPKND